MNVFNLLNVFFREDEREKVSSSATKLYFFLIYEANRSYWEGPLMLSVRRLSSLLSLSKNTVSKSLRELEGRGLITCYPRKENSLTANKEDSFMANKEGGLTANEEGGLTANEEDGLSTNREDSLKHPEGGSRKGSLSANEKNKLSTNKRDNLTANKGDSLTANEEDGFSENREDSLKRSKGGSRKESFTASVKGKGARSSAFWFADLELSETASRQTRMTASKQMRKEKKELYDKGGSKYAKFF